MTLRPTATAWEVVHNGRVLLADCTFMEGRRFINERVGLTA